MGTTTRTRRRKAIKVIGRQETKKAFSVCSILCATCPNYLLHNGVTHACTSNEICEMKEND